MIDKFRTLSLVTVHSLPAHNLGFEVEMMEYFHIKLVLMQTSFSSSSDNAENSYAVPPNLQKIGLIHPTIPVIYLHTYTKWELWAKGARRWKPEKMERRERWNSAKNKYWRKKENGWRRRRRRRRRAFHQSASTPSSQLQIPEHPPSLLVFN